MANSQIFSAALRISDTAVARPALEAALGTTLARYEPARTGSLYYAQVDLPIEEEVWGAIARWVKRLGPQLSKLRQERLIGSTSLDLAASFVDGQMSLSVVVPSFAAEIISSYGVDIAFSVYAVSDFE
ncbi:MAG: hypothetical protein QM780_03110 [Hyphomicrobium sp.]|uniref:hypothetical protein n=1 Tax=Hyphomicrobium sp. TaxID=82 RepID=UPI0039E28228